MGNRIHVAMGYGLTDVEYEKDSRFSEDFWESLYNKDYLPQMREINALDFSSNENNPSCSDWFEIIHFKAKIDKVGWYKNNEESINDIYVSDVLKFSGYLSEQESGPMVFVDCFHKDWYRFNDTLDYYLLGSEKDSVTMIETDGVANGIYPYMRYVNRKNGSFVKCYPIDRWASECAEEQASKFGMSVDEWKNDVIPEIPYNIRLFCRAANVFKDSLTVYSLRPMIYSYWC